MGEHQSFVAFIGQGFKEVLDQEGFAHTVGAVEQAAGPHGHQLFEAVAGFIEGVGGIGFVDRRAERQLSGAPEAFEGGVQVRRIYRGGHNPSRYRFWS